ncbi:DUF2946 domain-containing protein [Rhodopseudomonas sp. B29]|uniref:DUF2946 domain-containing protein n=1 Tax=Rhodopseudomonas sp. B29 TaxID=95607 RepID=UPI00034C0DB8|nr:DUF2946 domain-containing protein [Rhodopseudomonas sp. B29]
MRRRLGTFSPLAMLALMALILAPISAARLASLMVGDPLAHASICAGLHDGGSQEQPSQQPHQTDDCCAICAVLIDGVLAATPPSPFFVAVQRKYQLVTWLRVAEPTADIRVGSNTQPRAPPTLS